VKLLFFRQSILINPGLIWIVFKKEIMERINPEWISMDNDLLKKKKIKEKNKEKAEKTIGKREKIKLIQNSKTP